VRAHRDARRFAFAQRASTAARKIRLRSSAETFFQRLTPPVLPPFFPRATACGFFFLVATAANIARSLTFTCIRGRT
jgi:hypothetical protein